jgi:hypothetical protein
MFFGSLLKTLVEVWSLASNEVEVLVELNIPVVKVLAHPPNCTTIGHNGGMLNFQTYGLLFWFLEDRNSKRWADAVLLFCMVTSSPSCKTTACTG